MKVKEGWNPKATSALPTVNMDGLQTVALALRITFAWAHFQAVQRSTRALGRGLWGD